MGERGARRVGHGRAVERGLAAGQRVMCVGVLDRVRGRGSGSRGGGNSSGFSFRDRRLKVELKRELPCKALYQRGECVRDYGSTIL